MTDNEFLTERFEQQRARLRAVAYRMLNSPSEVDDAVQEAWLRLNRTDASSIDNLDGWLTTVLARVCLNMLRSRKQRAEQPLDSVHMPEPVVVVEHETNPEQQTLLADSVGLALLVVLDTLNPAERLALVLHDLFGVPFEEVARMIEKSAEATRQLVSRARRKVLGQAPDSDTDLARQREVVDAFFAAAHEGDFERLVEIMHPDVVLRSDGGARRPSASMIIRGARAVAHSTRTYGKLAPFVRPALINGTAGAVVALQGKRSPSWASPSLMARSPPSTCSLTPNASPNSTSSLRSDWEACQ